MLAMSISIFADRKGSLWRIYLYPAGALRHSSPSAPCPEADLRVQWARQYPHYDLMIKSPKLSHRRNTIRSIICIYAYAAWWGELEKRSN